MTAAPQQRPSAPDRTTIDRRQLDCSTIKIIREAPDKFVSLQLEIEITMLSNRGGEAGRGRGGGEGREEGLNTSKCRNIYGQGYGEDHASLKPDTNLEGRPDTRAETSWWIGNQFKGGAVYRPLICFTLDSADTNRCYFSRSSLTF